MLDTFRLTSSLPSVRDVPRATRFMTLRKHDGELGDMVVLNQFSNTKTHRYFYDPVQKKFSIEANASKLIYGDNWTNWGGDAHSLVAPLLSIARHFYSSFDSCEVSRLDLGFVQDFGSAKAAAAVLESFRRSRPPRVRTVKAATQMHSYKDSIFLPTRNWSIKIYNKGAEQRVTEYCKDAYLSGVLRFEKTYRSGEIARLHRADNKAFGILEDDKRVYIDELQPQLLIDDFFSTFQNWERMTWATDDGQMKNSSALLARLEQLGENMQLVENSGMVSRSTMYRYRAKKKTLLPLNPPAVEFKPAQGWKSKLDAFTFATNQFFIH